MGWGTQFKADIFISKELYHTKYEVEDEISDKESWIAKCKAKLLALALATPRDITPHNSDSDDPIWYVTKEVDYALESIEESEYKLFKLRLLLEHWEEKEDDEP